MDNLKGESKEFINYVDRKVKHEENFDRNIIDAKVKPHLSTHKMTASFEDNQNICSLTNLK